MGIYINGMEMPTRCEDCFCYRHNAEYDYAYCNISSVNVLGHGNARLNNCPLIPVPPHGRCIDADAFSAKIIEIVERQKYDDFYAQSLSVGAILREVVNELKGAGLDGYANNPTIIPADPAEEGE